MTGILAVAANGKVFMGSDSIYMDGWARDATAQDKVFIRGNRFMFGCAGSPRMAQVLRYLVPFPREQHKGESAEEYLVTVLIESVRSTMREAGCLEIDNGVEGGAAFLLGYKGKVYAVHHGFQLHEPAQQVIALGAASDTLLASVLTQRVYHGGTFRDAEIEYQIKTAFVVAEQVSSAVVGPYRLDVLDEPTEVQSDGLVSGFPSLTDLAEFVDQELLRSEPNGKQQ